MRGRHVLLVAGEPGAPPACPPWARRWADQLIVVAAGSFPAGSAYLVRPDGYLAARGSAGGAGPLPGYLRAVFGTPAALGTTPGSQ
jgi:hypothetical protein